MRHTVHTCGACQTPMTDNGYLCWDCVNEKDGLRDLLSRLTAAVIGASSRRPGESWGRGKSTVWDTPSGEAANLPRMLVEARARQVRFAVTPSVRGKGREPVALAIDLRAGDHLTGLYAVLARISSDVHAATGTVPPVTGWGAAARWVDTHLDKLRCLETAPTHLADLRRRVQSAESHVDRPNPPRFWGGCLTVGCSGELWARTGADTAACTKCGTLTPVQAARDAVRARVEDSWVTTTEASRLTALLGERVPVTTIDSWRARGRVASTGDDPVRVKFADVLARLEAKSRKTA